MESLKRLGLIAAALTLIHGLYLAFYFLWVLILILMGLSSSAPPILNPLALALLDTAVYLFVGVGMLRGRRGYYVYAVLWTLWGALLGTFVVTYKSSILNLLSFLIVFSCTYYHVSANKTSSEVVKTLGRVAGGLAVIQGIIVIVALLLLRMGFLPFGLISVIKPHPETIFAPTFFDLLVTGGVYLALGLGMLRRRQEVFFLTIFWTIVEAVLAIANQSYTYTHFNVISMTILAFATYYYFSKAKT